MFEFGADLDIGVVDAGAIATFEVLDKVFAVDETDDGVFAADGRQVDDDLAIPVAAHDPLVAAFQGNDRVGAVALFDFQRWHCGTSGGMKLGGRLTDLWGAA